MDEHLYLRKTGGAEVTRQLIDHVMEVAQRRDIEMQVLPLVRRSHAGLGGPIVLLETPENRWFAYSEGQETGQLLSERRVVSMLPQRYAKLRSQALTPEDSMSLLERLRGAV